MSKHKNPPKHSQAAPTPSHRPKPDRPPEPVTTAGATLAHAQAVADATTKLSMLLPPADDVPEPSPSAAARNRRVDDPKDPEQMTEEEAQREANPDLKPVERINERELSDLYDGPPPVLDTTHVDDLPPQSAEEKAAQEALLAAQAKADILGKAPPPKPKAAPATKVLVHNTTARLFTVALYAPVDPSRPVASSKTFQLLPGLNPVPVEIWARAKSELSIQRLMQERELVELDATSLLETAEKKAIELVDLTVSLPLLLEWDRTEKRTRVRQAIAAQVAKIGPTEKPKPDAELDEDEDEDQE